ncbi:Exonuclease mut-7, partial [Rhizopus stolonifer]
MEDSDDDEWEITSSPVTNKKREEKKKRPTISAASIRTIRANLPKLIPIHVVSAPITPVASPAPIPPPVSLTPPPPTTHVSLQYISDDELKHMCQQMDSDLLMLRLIHVYKSADIYLKIREIETPGSLIEVRLCRHLHYCQDPSDFILNTLSSLSSYFTQHSRNKELLPKFRRLLSTNLCTALAKFLDTPIDKQRAQCAQFYQEIKEVDLISFEDQATSSLAKEMDLISFDEQPLIELHNSNILGMPADFIERYTLRRDNQLKLIHMMDSISCPVIVYYAMDVYRLPELIAKGCEFEAEGVKLCRILIKHAYYDEAVTSIRKLDLFACFSVERTAEQFFTAGYGAYLITLYQGQPDLQRQLVSYINKQLRFTYAGNLDIVPAHHFEDLATDNIPQLSRLKERKFQKDLVGCGAKLLKEIGLEGSEQEGYFIHLSQRYSCLRFILAQRAIQQIEDNDTSIATSSNFNGLIDLVCENDPVMARLAIKELIDMGDAIAPAHFASLYKQQEFYCRYNALPLNQRLLGIVKGEIMSRHQSTLTPKKTKKLVCYPFYQLPAKAQCVVVDSIQTLLQMKDVLSTSTVCGLDTEWVPTFAKTTDVKTALMQIATDIDGFVFLLDLKTILEPQHTRLLQLTEIILRLLFEDEQILKLGNNPAFDFTGDLDLLHLSIPSSKHWKMNHLLDLKTIKSKQGSVVTGGLAGVVAEFLACSLNKRQQLSNWEKRPLSEEQILYGACDAY